MFPKLDISEKLSFDLRQPYSTRRGNDIQNFQFERLQPVFDYMDGHLDLSIHHSSTPFGNRFAPLAPPEASVQRDREFYASRPHRRTRNSRGTKEAKKRRDSRREKRKFAVRLLNEQLSGDNGETLFQHNIHHSPLISPTTPAPVIPMISASEQIYDYGSTHVAPSAPQLPPITFHGFRLPDFQPLIMPRTSPPPSPVPMLAGVPAWCPPISSLTTIGSGTGKLPKFYDLSCLPEPTCSLSDEGECRYLQVWKGNRAPMSKKQSRFFPPHATSSKTKVRLPPTGPTCPRYGVDLHNALDEAWKASNASTKPDSITQAIERIMDAARDVEPACKETQSPSGANLWNILAKSAQESIQHASEHSVRYEDNGASAELVANPRFNEQFGPFELPGIGIPYVHPNSLTGYANETAAQHSEGSMLGDSAVYLADVFASNTNMTLSHVPYGIPQKYSPRIPTLRIPVSDCCAGTINANQFINIVVDTKSESIEGGQDDSIAQFKSEHELFALPSQTVHTAESPFASVCDLATFLSMGHADHCWCHTCEEEPELVSETTALESEESFTEDDGWMIWSNNCDVEASTTAVKHYLNSSTQIEQQSFTPRPSTRSETWDEYFPRNPRRARALNKSEPDGQFLGYYDDGAAFAPDSDGEWEWNF